MNVRIQYRFLFILLAVTAVLAVVVVGVRHFQISRNASAFLTQARRSAEAGRDADAVRFYTQYLGLNHDSADAQAELAEILLKQGNLGRAFFNLEAALRLDPDRLEARQSLAKVAMGLNRHADAKTHLADHLIPSDPENAEYRWLLGVCETRLNNLDAALEQLQLANRSESSTTLYAASLADFLSSRMNQHVTAREVLDEAVAKFPEDPVAHLARGRWLLGRSDRLSTGENAARRLLLETAWEDAESAMRLSEGAVESVLLFASVAIASERTNEAREAISAAIKANPGVAQLYASAANVELINGNPEAASAYLKEGLKIAPNNQELLFKRAELELNADNLEAAERLVADLRAGALDPALLRYLEGRLLIGRGQFKAAVDLLESSRALFDRRDDLLRDIDYMLSICYRSLGNPDQEIEALRRSISNAPLSAVTREALAIALMRSGRTQEAISRFRQLAQQPAASPSVLINLARLMFIDGLGRDLQGADWDPLRQVLEVLESKTENSPDIAILRAELLFVDKQPDEAESVLKSALEVTPKEASLYQALVALLIRKQAWDEVQATLDAAQQVLSDSALVRLERGRYLIRRHGDQVDMAELEQLAAAPADWEDAERIRLASGFAGYFLSLEDFQRAEQQARIVAKSEGGNSNLAIHLLLLDMAFRSGNQETLTESLAKVNQLEGGGPLWQVGEAIRLSIEAGKLDESKRSERNRLYAKANEHLSDAAVARPGWPRIPSLRGEIFERLDQREQALQAYMEAISLGEQNPQVISRAILILFEQGRFVDADKVVRKMQEQNTPFSSDLTRVASQISLQLDNFERALSLATEWARKSDRQEDHVYLAQILSISGEFEKAEAEFRVAIDKDPAEPGPWVALAQVFARIGNREAALGVIEDARGAIRPEDLDDALAQCYQSIRDDELAERSYLAAVEKAPNNTGLLRRFAEFYLASGRAPLAQPLLERVASDENDADPLDQAWARRNLALVLAAEGSQEAIDRARQLIGTNIERNGETLNEKRTLAWVLGMRSGSDSVAEAIRILEDVIKQQRQFSLVDNHLLAELYFRSDDWARYRRTMRGVMSNGGADKSQYVQDFAEKLLRRGELNEGQIWFNRLKEMAPDELATATVEANLLLQAGNHAKLLELLETNGKLPQRRDWAAGGAESVGLSLKRQGQTDQANAFLQLAQGLFTEIADDDPERSLALASFHARQGEFTKALEWFGKAEYTADQLPAFASSALKSGRLDVQFGQRLIEILKADREQATDKPSFDTILGDLAGWVGDGSEASAAYRRILETQPNQVVALNNLAMVLALTGREIEEAGSAIDRAIQTAGPVGFLLDTRSLVRLAAGNLKGAENDLAAAIIESPQPDRYFHLAQVLVAQNRMGEAKAAFEKAVAGGLDEEAVHPLERPAVKRLSEQFKVDLTRRASAPAI